MLTTISVSENLIREAGIYGKADQRSVSDQIGHRIRIGKCAEENPDLTYDLIREILIGIGESDVSVVSVYFTIYSRSVASLIFCMENCIM